MGTWATFVIAKAAAGAGLPADAPKHWLLGQRDHWVFYELAKMVPALKLDRFAENWAKECPDIPLIAYSVEDSDLAYVVGAISGSIGLRLVFNAEMADYLEGQDGPLIQLIQAGEAGVTSQAEQAAEWSAVLPKKVSAPRLKRWLRKDWDFAEEAVGKFLGAAGLEFPEEQDESERFGEAQHVFPLKGKKRIGETRVTDREARYVQGEGDGFFGVWDRQEREAPVATYPHDEAGFNLALHKWYELELEHQNAHPQPPEPDAGVLEAQKFPEAINVYRDMQMRIGDRLVDSDETRYVIGVGAGFLGIWDREAPGPPLHRFPFTQPLEESAGVRLFEEAEKVWRKLESTQHDRESP